METLRRGLADGSGSLGPLKVLFSSEHTTSRFVLCEQSLPCVALATDRTTSPTMIVQNLSAGVTGLCHHAQPPSAVSIGCFGHRGKTVTQTAVWRGY